MAKTKEVNAEDTKEKICEARYFLDKMEENQGELRPFRYNLSAFVSAFFSITSFMHKELNCRCGFKEWYDAELRPWMENDSMMRLLYKSRTTTVHIRGIPTRKNATVHLAAIGGDGEPWSEHKWWFDLYEEIKNIPDIDSIIQIDVIAICKTCFKELTRRISACDEGLLKPVC